MKTSIMSYVAASALALASSAAPVVSEIALLEGERWWGGAGGDGQNQPYGAPVLTPDDEKTVELPAGRWRDDLGETVEGPKMLRLENVPLSRLPRYERIGG